MLITFDVVHEIEESGQTPVHDARLLSSRNDATARNSSLHLPQARWVSPVPIAEGEGGRERESERELLSMIVFPVLLFNSSIEGLTWLGH